VVGDEHLACIRGVMRNVPERGDGDFRLEWYPACWRGPLRNLKYWYKDFF
jgi:hypothetical protein